MSALPDSLVVVDVETTGLDPLACSLLSIGAVVPATGDEFYAECRVWAGARIETRALEVNGCSRERCVDIGLPDPARMVGDFVVWSHTRGLGVLAGMNPRFDREFLAGALSPGLRLPFSHRTVDLHALAYAYAVRKGVPVPSSGFHTDAIYALLQLPPEPKPHNALTGARREAEALRILIGGASDSGNCAAPAAAIEAINGLAALLADAHTRLMCAGYPDDPGLDAIKAARDWARGLRDSARKGGG